MPGSVLDTGSAAVSKHPASLLELVGGRRQTGRERENCSRAGLDGGSS